MRKYPPFTLHPRAYDRITDILGLPSLVPRQVVDQLVEVIIEDQSPLDLYSPEILAKALVVHFNAVDPPSAPV
mgnify:CR=1 FL=1